MGGMTEAGNDGSAGMPEGRECRNGGNDGNDGSGMGSAGMTEARE